MPPIIKNVADPESLNRPDDSAHEKFNNLTLKDTDETDEDGHYRRKGAHLTGTVGVKSHIAGYALSTLVSM